MTNVTLHQLNRMPVYAFINTYLPLTAFGAVVKRIRELDEFGVSAVPRPRCIQDQHFQVSLTAGTIIMLVSTRYAGRVFHWIGLAVCTNFNCKLHPWGIFSIGTTRHIDIGRF